MAGVRTLARLDGPKVWSGELSPMASTAGEEYLFSTTDLIGNSIFPIGTSFFTACIANCHLLGLDPQNIMKDDAVWPFSQQTQEVLDDEHRANIPDFGSTTKSPPQVQSHDFTNDMRPTLEQLTISHHPYLDIIPWPSFRARAIVASSIDPPLIDEGDLCLDLLSNGLYCWGMRGLSLHGRGEGTPWDSRSWEAIAKIVSSNKWP
ncbi:hypothetical protein V1523DRAFT_420296 [Lipomyces doorenjongii]